ncbi:signal transduction histidine kinase, partial [Schizophyllum fasciatum]
INMDTFQQLLDLDEDETHDFSRGMVDAYFSQAESTFEDMDKALKSSDLPKLSSLGHFLKGSSATLGVSRVQLSCQKIQHYGEKKNEGKDLSDADALSRINELLGKVKVDFRTAEEWLQEWYRENAVED